MFFEQIKEADCHLILAQDTKAALKLLNPQTLELMSTNTDALAGTQVIAAQLLSFDAAPSFHNFGLARSLEVIPAKHGLSEGYKQISFSPLKKRASVIEP